MKLRKALWLSGGGLALLTALYAGTSSIRDPFGQDQSSSLPRAFRVYNSLEPFDDVDLPADYKEQTEWVQARLMYPPHPQGRFSRPLRFGGNRDWREGGTSWSQDYPRADRNFAMAVRRLTRVHVRSVEQPVNPDDGGDIFNWPWLVVGEMGDWKLTEAQAVKVREYLLRGGFLMMDDFWGSREWARFMESMSAIFPNRPIVEIDDKDPIFHIVYDLNERGIYDDYGRLMVAMSFNSDIGDSWEWADDPRYPEKYSALGIRIGVNDVVYSMTH
jgi:hypothetical protein